MQNHSNENEFDLHENEPVGGTHFHLNGFALVLTRRQKGTWRWPIVVFSRLLHHSIRLNNTRLLCFYFRSLFVTLFNL